VKKYVIGLVLMVAALVVAGCKGGGQGGSTKINVAITDFAFDPKTFTVPAGKEISFSGRNNGAVTHDFIILKKGADIGDSFGSEDEASVFWKTEIQAGATAQETFTAPAEPGDYQVICGVPGHFQAGMVATLTVTP
jgi:uncharacterized cupredoxin-like copper-binding protein